MLHVQVRNERQEQRVSHESGPLLIGRAPEGEGAKLVVEDLRVSRRQLRIEALSGGSVRLENLGKDVRLDDGSVLPRGSSRDIALPVSLRVGHTTLDLSVDSAELSTIAPPVTGELRLAPAASLASLGEAPEPEQLTQWFETLLAVQAAAASSDAFHERTARALVELVGLDRGLVMRRDGEDWTVLASHAKEGGSAEVFSRTVLAGVLRDRRTYYDSPSGPDLAQSLLSLECVVASPIFDPQGQVAGVVYGSRDLRRAPSGRGITPLEAQVVQLLAGAVSAGLARLDQEAEAARLRVQFEQFFSPKLASELERNPRLLDATEREITVLFSDVRGFSSLSERLGARRTYEMIGDLLDGLTKQVLAHGGVIVDYYGDGLEAMWNAPADQPDHAVEACRAALAMQAEMPGLNDTWSHEVGEPLRVGIGLHSGRALVGNAGSSRRMKYGPRGHVVNLASRVESATKKLGVSVLVTDAVAGGLAGADGLTLRRLGRARMAGIDELVGLHELRGRGEVEPLRAQADAAHAQALAALEEGRFAEAEEIAALAGDDPALAHLVRSARAADEAAFDLRRK